MSADEKILKALENAINEFGNLRQHGITIGYYSDTVNEARLGLWRAWYEYDARVKAANAAKAANIAA